MSKKKTFEGVEHTFPDDATPEEISEAMNSFHPKPPENPGLMKRGFEFLAKQLGRVPAAMRGYATGLKSSDQYSEAIPEALSQAGKGFMSPESVPSSAEAAAQFGAKTEQRPTDVAFSTGPDTRPHQPRFVNSSQAEDLGALFDMIAPTGLEFLPPIFAQGMKKSGATARAAGVENIQGALKPSKALRESPSPYKGENLLKEYPGAPEGGLASMRGKGKTLENIEALHETLGDQQDAILKSIPRMDARTAVYNAQNLVDQALASGGDNAAGIGARDAQALQAELNYWRDYLKSISDQNGMVTGQMAKNLRSSLGSAAKYDKSASSNAKEVIAATIREELNQHFSKLSPEFRALDKQFAETIPLRNAMADAIGKEGNRYSIGLRTAMMLANPADLASEVGKIAMIEGSSRFAPNVMLAKGGRALENAGEAASELPVYPIPSFLRAAQEKRQQQNTLPSFLQVSR